MIFRIHRKIIFSDSPLVNRIGVKVLPGHEFKVLLFICIIILVGGQILFKLLTLFYISTHKQFESFLGAPHLL